MRSVVTVCFSPCIDKSTSVECMIPEIKLKCSEPVREPGGGGINVARAIVKLGGKVLAVYPAGGPNGAVLSGLMRKERVPSVVTCSVHETRENIVVYDTTGGLQYRFNMPAPALADNEWLQILRAVEQVNDARFIIVSGSLPPGIPKDIFSRLQVIAKKNEAKLIVDTSGPPLQAAMKEGAFLIKPSLRELCFLAGKQQLEKEEIRETAIQLIRKSSCEVMVVSLGKAGALLVTKDISTIIASPIVETRSTVGAGDSLVAGIALSLTKGLDLVTAVTYGVACGTAATMNPGTELCSYADAENLFHSMVA